MGKVVLIKCCTVKRPHTLALSLSHTHLRVRTPAHAQRRTQVHLAFFPQPFPNGHGARSFHHCSCFSVIEGAARVMAALPNCSLRKDSEQALPDPRADAEVALGRAESPLRSLPFLPAVQAPPGFVDHFHNSEDEMPDHVRKLYRL